MLWPCRRICYEQGKDPGDAVKAGAGQGAEEESVLEEGKAGEEMKIGLIDVDSQHEDI